LLLHWRVRDPKNPHSLHPLPRLNLQHLQQRWLPHLWPHLRLWYHNSDYPRPLRPHGPPRYPTRHLRPRPGL